MATHLTNSADFSGHAGIPTQSNATHAVDRLIGTHPTEMRVIEDLCFTPAIDKNAARQEDAQEFLSLIMHQMHDE
ncbi:hypothetical protein Tco_0885754 [Tanacetum coccineum]